MTTPEIPSGEPLAVTAGDTWNWTRSLSDYPASDWTLSYSLLNDSAAVTPVRFSATADGDDHLVTETPAATIEYAAGRYLWQAFVTHNTDARRYTLDSGHITVKPDFATSTADPRSQVKKTLDAINDLLQGKAGADKISFKIGNIEIQKMTPKDLMAWRENYRQLYQEELDDAAGDDNGISETYLEFTQR